MAVVVVKVVVVAEVVVLVVGVAGVEEVVEAAAEVAAEVAAEAAVVADQAEATVPLVPAPTEDAWPLEWPTPPSLLGTIMRHISLVANARINVPPPYCCHSF